MTYRHCLSILAMLVLLGSIVTASVSAQAPDGDEPTPQAPEMDLSLPRTPGEEARETPLGEPDSGALDLPANQINAVFWFDYFNRPDGPLGGNWTVHGGTINIVSGYAQGTAGAGSSQRATFNGARADVVQADVAMNGTGQQFSALILNHDGSTNSDYVYFKVQNQDGDNLYERGACYSYTGAEAGFGLGFFLLDSPFQTGHLRTERIGNDLHIDITNVDSGGQPDQHYVCSGAPVLTGNLTGIRFWEEARLDNWCAGPECDARPGLYTVRDTDNVLRWVDLNDMTITDVGPLGVSFAFGGLAYDPNSDTLYMIDGRGAESLYTVDRNTGAATLVGAHGVTDLFGLAYDSTNDVLYGAQFGAGNGFYSLDLANGAATYVGDMGRRIGGMAYNAHTDQLIGIEDALGDLYEIDRATGATTLLHDGGFTNNSGLTFDLDRSLYWDIDYNGNLYSYDPDYGYIRLQHLSGLGPHDGAVYVPALSGFAPPADYVSATWIDESVHLLDDGLVDQGSFSAGATNPNGIATDGTVIWTGHFTTQEVIGHNFAGTELFRWSGTLLGLQGMELVEGDLAICRFGNIEFFHPYDGTYIRSIPAFSGSVEGIAYNGELLWQIVDTNLYGVDPADGSLISTIPNAAAGCAYAGTGIAAHAPNELTLACTDGSWYKVSTADGSVIDSGNNGLNMYGLAAYVNTPPLAEEDAYGTDEDTAFTTGSVLDNDSDGQGPVFFASYDDTGLLGLLSYNGDGTFDYAPDGQFEALGTGDQALQWFTYTILDTGGLTDTATVTLTIDGVNDPPLAEGDAYGTDEDTAFTTGDVLDNDLDAEGPVGVASYDDTGLLGLLDYNGDGTFDYDPDGQFEALGSGDQGFEFFTYTISDTGGLTDTATVTITIDGVNDPPLAEGDVYTTSQDTPLVVVAPGVLDNDDDVEGDALQAMWDSGPSNGDLSLSVDGSFVYTPTAGFSGVDTFGYYANDGLSDSGLATVTLTVTEAPCTEISTATLTLLTGGTIYPDDPVDLLLDLLPEGYTPPFSYTLDFDDGSTISDVASLAPITLTHTYTAAGAYQVLVEVWNCAMSQPVSDSAQITVTEPPYEIYLPIVFRSSG